MRLHRAALVSLAAVACATAVACNDRYRCAATVECAPLGSAYQCLGGFCAKPGAGSSSGGGNGSSVAASGGSSASSSLPTGSSAAGSSSAPQSSSTQGSSAQVSSGQASSAQSSSQSGSSDSNPAATSSVVSGPASSSSLPSSSGPPAFPQVHAQLTWSTPTGDLDIHLIRRGTDGGFVRNSPVDDCSPTNCRNMNIGWDGDAGRGVGGNPVVDIDDLIGYGPENINIAATNNGSYLLGALSQGLDGGTQATLRLWVNTALTDTRDITMATDQFWTSIVFHVDGGLVTLDVVNTLEPR